MNKNDLIKCYHISPINKRSGILKYGLIPKANTVFGYPPRLFFSIDKNILGFDYVGFDNIDIWTFYLTKNEMKPDNNTWDSCFMFTTTKIKVKNLKLYKTII